MNKKSPYNFLFISLIFIAVIGYDINYSQDSTKIKTDKDTSIIKTASDTLKVKIPEDTIPPVISIHRYQYLNLINPDTITRNRFLWYPLKGFDNIFDFTPGYFVDFMDVGQVQKYSYNQLDENNTVVLRNGRPINDLFDGTIDMNLFSRNEIAEVENTNGLGNVLYNFNNAVNIIQRQVFQKRPYSELSYWQDLNANLYFDGNYQQNIFKPLNLNVGITKNSYDGNFINSDFDKWQGRFNLNYIGSKKFNLFLYTNYAKTQRGANEGLDLSRLPDLNQQTLLYNSLGLIRNANARDTRERFDVDMGALITYGKKNDSYTKIQFFESNSYRRYNDTIPFVNITHWIDYGVKIQQIINYSLLKGINFNSRTEFEIDKDIIFSDLNSLRNSERNFFLENVEVGSKFLDVNAYGKIYKFQYYNNKYYSDFGLYTRLKYNFFKTNLISIFGQYSKSNVIPNYRQYFLDEYLSDQTLKQYKIGASLSTKFGELMAEYYINKNNKSFANGNFFVEPEYKGINAKLTLKIKPIDFEFNYSRVFEPVNVSNMYPTDVIPHASGNIILSYHDMGFKNKLEYKIGLTSRFWASYWAEFYDGLSNSFMPFYIDTSGVSHTFLIGKNATLDFFVVARIDKAVFGITFENILNRAIYTTGLYPNQSRGGLFNVWSRFNITWYFLN